MSISKGNKFSDLNSEITKAKTLMKEILKLRPNANGVFPTTQGSDGTRIPMYNIFEEDLYKLALQSDIITTIINALIKGTFRRGFETPEIQKNEGELEILNKWIKQANYNKQSLADILKSIDKDKHILNNSYLIAIQDYTFVNGEIYDVQLKELVRGHPLKIRVIADSKGRLGYNDSNEKIYFSLHNRKTTIIEKKAKQTDFLDEKGCKLQLACYRAQAGTGQTGKNEYIYYSSDEVLHITDDPTLLYGYSKLFPVWMKVRTLIEMDRYLMLAYQKQRPPRGLLSISTTNFASANKAWQSLMAKARDDPSGLHPFIYENSANDKQSIQFTELLKSPAEMQMIEFRNEMRRQIGAIYGVMPLFSGDLQTSGGLNNESQQMAVTNRSLEESQKQINEKVLPWILNKLKITNYDLVLAEPEERDETEDIKRLGMKMDNAMKMKQMGFEVTFDTNEQEFSFSENSQAPMDLETNTQPDENTQLGGMPQKNISKDIQKDVEKALSDFGDDKEFITYISKELYDKTFEGLKKETSNQIRNIVLSDFIEKNELKTTIKKIKDLGVDSNQAENIARTERNGLTNKSREFRYSKQEPNALFKWEGPSDHRTTPICKELESLTKKGMKLEDLKKLVNQKSKEYGYNMEGWTPHFQCRHSFIRKL